MSLKADFRKKIDADREAGRDIPPVLEEFLMMIAEFVETSATKKAAAKADART